MALKKNATSRQGEWQKLRIDMGKLLLPAFSYKDLPLKILTPDQEKAPQSIENKDLKNIYLFKKRVINPSFADGIQYAPIRSCLLHNKSDKEVWEIRHNPKYYTTLKKTTYNVNTGEITADCDYITDDLTSGNGRKIRAVNTFTSTFSDLYKNGAVSLLFYTLTTANQSSATIQEITNVIKKRITRNGLSFYGYLWVLEISPTGHIHYHLLLATSRFNIRGKGMPDFLKLDNVWGAICQVEFVKKSVRYYLSKYFYKNKSRITGKRLFSKTISKEFYNHFPNHTSTTQKNINFELEKKTPQQEKNNGETTEKHRQYGEKTVTIKRQITEMYDIWEMNTTTTAKNMLKKNCVNDKPDRQCKGG